MKLVTYTSTPGLERLPKRERFVVWQATHKKLLSNDAEYRKRFYSYLIALVCLSGAMLPFYLPYFGVRLFGAVADVLSILGLATLIVFLAVRQMAFMNRKIGNFLESKP